MSSAFWSGFAGSAFSVGNKGYGGTTGRTLIMATVGGTVSQLTGGKFANGAVSGAFVHMFNAEGLCSVWKWIISPGECLRDKLGTKVDYDYLRYQYCAGGYGAGIYYCSTLNSPYANAECRVALDRYNSGLDDPECGDDSCSTK